MKRLLSSITKIGVGLLLTLPGIAAESSSLEDRLKAVEDKLAQVVKENTQLKTELGYTGKSPLVVVKPKGKVDSITIGGYIQAHAEFGDAPDARFSGIEDRFLIRRARLGVQGIFAEHFDFKLESDFGNNAIAGKSGYSAQLTDVFVNWNRYDSANVKVGQFKTPFGYEQLLADTKILTIERSLPNDVLTLSRQIGLNVAGDFLDKRLGYAVGVFNGFGVNNGSNDNSNFQYVSRLTGTPYKGKWGKQDVSWNIGINGYATQDNGLKISGFGFDSTPGGSADSIFTGDRTGWAVDTQFKLGAFGLYGEYFQSRFEPANGNNTLTTVDDSFDGTGWYVMGSYDILPKRLQAVVRFESFDPNTDIRGNSTDEWTVGLNYFIKGDDIKLSANYLLGDQPGASEWKGRFLTRIQIAF